VEFIKNDPLSLGALVTTHKIDLYAACQDLFDVIDPHALRMGETSCLSKHNGAFVCHAKDAITSGLTLDHAIVGADHFARNPADMFCMGAGGSTIAMSWHMAQPERGANRPRHMVFSDLSSARLDELAEFHHRARIEVPCSYRLVKSAEENDALLQALPAGSLVVNATGLGKDRPGAPITAAAQFPERALVWELNYRGNLLFLDYARAQAKARSLQVHDGWTYFIYGWTSVIAEVFHVDIPSTGLVLEDMSALAQHAPAQHATVAA
jgi:shikimate 5-dehydrogenase